MKKSPKGSEASPKICELLRSMNDLFLLAINELVVASKQLCPH